MPLSPRLLMIATALAGLPATAGAETLREALAAAYDNNPTLTAARSGQRATDETVPIARADGLPAVNATVGVNHLLHNELPSTSAADSTLTMQGQLSVPVYQGGVVRNAVRAAESRVESGQASLRGTEASVFSQVVAAYMDVLRTEAVVSLNHNNVEVLTVNLRAARDRFDIGDVTRTDVAQSEARLALARGSLEGAQAQLIAARETFIRLVGHPPVDLVPPPPLPGLPATSEDAVTTALAENPDLEAAQISVRAAGYDVRSARGTRMPRVALTTTGTRYDYLGTLGQGLPGAYDQTLNSAAAGVNVTIPLFQGGRPAARVRQAQARQSQAIEDAVGAERSVIAQTRAAFASWQAAQSVIQSSQVAVQANQLSLEGVRAENSVGTRTILDILNAEQELLNAQVQLVNARRDAYVAGFTLLAAMGRAEADDLGVADGTALYDPAANYERVRGRFWDWDEDPAPQPVSTRTVGTPAQTATVPPGDTPSLAQ